MDQSEAFDAFLEEKGVQAQPATMASHSDILDSSTSHLGNMNKVKIETFMVQTLDSLLNFPKTQEEKENSRFAVTMTNQKEIAQVQKQIEQRTGIKQKDQAMLTINTNGDVLKYKEIDTDTNNIIVYDNRKHLCAKIITNNFPEIMLVQFENTDTLKNLHTYLAEWGLPENEEKIMLEESGDMDSMEPGTLLKSLLPTDMDDTLVTIQFEKTLDQKKIRKKDESIVLNYDGQTHDQQKIDNATEILSVAFECHPLSKKVFQSRIKVKDGQFFNTIGDINPEEDMECFRNIVAELTGNDDFIELVQEKLVSEHNFGQWRDTPTFKTLVKSLFLDIPNMELIHKVYKKREQKNYPLWNSDQNIENYRNSLPNILITRNFYEGHLHKNFLCNIERISGSDITNYCRMGRVLPGDAIYIYHRRWVLGDYAHVVLYTGLQMSGIDEGPDHPVVKATKDMLYCVHLKAVETWKIVVNKLGDATTIACESLSKAISDDAECFVVRGSEDGETRRRFVRRAFQLTEPPFAFDYDAKGGNCESVISAIWELWDNLTPQGKTISNRDGCTRQKVLSKTLRWINPLALDSLKIKLQSRLPVARDI